MNTRNLPNNIKHIIQKRKRTLLKRIKVCSRCGCKSNLTVDHVVPVVKGGHWTSIKNLDILCEYCNSDKGSKLRKDAIVINGIDYNFVLDRARRSIHLAIEDRAKHKKYNTHESKV